MSESIDVLITVLCCYVFQSSIGWPKIGIRLENHRTRILQVRALGNSSDGQTPIAPLQFESPTGQLLSQIMQTHPHLLPAAIDQQLERLQSDIDAENAKTPVASQDLPLYRFTKELYIYLLKFQISRINFCCLFFMFRPLLEVFVDK